MTSDHLLFGFALLTAEVLGTIGGFGSSMLVMPLAVWFLPYDQALGLTALFHVFSNAAKMILFRQGIDRRLLIWLGIPAVVGVIVGARLTVYLDERWSALSMGILLVVMAVIMLARPEMRLKSHRSTAIAGGASSGLLAGIAGTGGAVRGLALAAFGLEKAVLVGTSARIDMGVDLSRTIVYGAQGFITQGVLVLIPIMAVTSLGGSWLGRAALSRIDQRQFRTVVLVLVILAGLATMVRAL